VQRILALDVRAAFEGDPAAANPDEVIFCYPGIVAITNHRLAHELHILGVPIIPRMITEAAHSATGIDIHPGATIGDRFFIDHGTGVVIGETCIIGSRVRIYQGVTLGAKSFQLDGEGHPVRGIDRHPIVEDDVTIYSGATILGRVTIGHGSVIGGNVWLVHGVPPGSRITQAQTREDVFERGAGIFELVTITSFLYDICGLMRVPGSLNIRRMHLWGQMNERRNEDQRATRQGVVAPAPCDG
jgi:serine O-acetyltransferase